MGPTVAIAYAHGSHNIEACINMPANALIATECTATAHDTPHSIYKAPPIAFIDPESTVVHAHLIESYILLLLAPASQSKNEACTAMSIGLTESATITPSLRFQHTVSIITQVMSFRCTPIHCFHENIMLAFSSPCHFTLGSIFIGVALPCPLKPDKPWLPTSLPQATYQPCYSSPAPISLMTEDSHY